MTKHSFGSILFRALVALALLLGPVQAQVIAPYTTFMQHGVGYSPISTVTGATETYQGHTNNISAAASYTFTSAAIGTAAANRDVVVGTDCSGGATIETVTGVTIGGSSATQSVVSTQAAAGDPLTGLWILPVAAGTTATIVINLSNNKTTQCSIDVWATYGLTSTTATNTSTANSTGAISLSVTNSNGGLAFGELGQLGASTGTWGGTLANDNNSVVNANAATAAGSQQTTGASATMTYSLTTARGAVMASYF